MVITLQIDKVESGLYRAAVLKSGIDVTAPSMHASITDAINAAASDVPEGFAYFADVTYGSASSGTISLKELTERAEDVADHLVKIVAEMHQIDPIAEKTILRGN